MIVSRTASFSRGLILISTLAVGLWLVLQQKGCEWVPQPPSVHASMAASGRMSLPFSTDATIDDMDMKVIRDRPPQDPGTQGTRARSLKRAGILLQKAAGLLDKNERVAFQLIRQAIAILKHDVVHALGPPEHDRVSLAPEAGLAYSNHGRMMRYEP